MLLAELAASSVDSRPDHRPAPAPTVVDWAEADDPALRAIVRECLGTLPERLLQVLLLRERLARDPAQICRELGLSRAECDDLLFRARMQLRARIDERLTSSPR